MEETAISFMQSAYNTDTILIGIGVLFFIIVLYLTFKKLTKK